MTDVEIQISLAALPPVIAIAPSGLQASLGGVRRVVRVQDGAAPGGWREETRDEAPVLPAGWLWAPTPPPSASARWDFQTAAWVEPPPPPARVSYATVRLRLTEAERAAILVARRADAALDDWITLAAAEGEIVLGSPTVEAAKAALVSAGLLSAARAAEVFAP
jgi:hypothetical protein